MLLTKPEGWHWFSPKGEMLFLAAPGETRLAAQKLQDRLTRKTPFHRSEIIDSFQGERGQIGDTFQFFQIVGRKSDSAIAVHDFHDGIDQIAAS